MYSLDKGMRSTENVVPAGETVVWSGAPRRGLLLSKRDVLLIPFSLFLCGFTVFWETSVVSSGAPFFFRIWGVPFVLAGLYMVIGRFFAEAFVRARTTYVVTDRAAYVAYAGPFPAVKRYAGSALATLDYQPAANGSGTIRFTPSVSPFSRNAGWSYLNPIQSDEFAAIPNARAVYDLVLTASWANG
jgi:hypothetical protein